jgi:hypothetical protein
MIKTLRVKIKDGMNDKNHSAVIDKCGTSDLEAP